MWTDTITFFEEVPCTDCLSLGGCADQGRTCDATASHHRRPCPKLGIPERRVPAQVWRQGAKWMGGARPLDFSPCSRLPSKSEGTQMHPKAVVPSDSNRTPENGRPVRGFVRPVDSTLHARTRTHAETLTKDDARDHLLHASTISITRAQTSDWHIGYEEYHVLVVSYTPSTYSHVNSVLLFSYNLPSGKQVTGNSDILNQAGIVIASCVILGAIVLVGFRYAVSGRSACRSSCTAE